MKERSERETEVKERKQLTSAAHDTSIRLDMVAEILQTVVMLTGRLGRFGSTPGRLEGMRLGRGAGLPLTRTPMEWGNMSSWSDVVSVKQNLIKTWT